MAASVLDGTPSMTSSSSGPDSIPSQQLKKIKRIQLSCTACRHRKLKCNRIQPCENCIKRGHASACIFANPGPQKTPGQARLSARNNELQQRLLRLEELVVSLSSRNGGASEGTTNVAQARQTLDERPDQDFEKDKCSAGIIVTDHIGTRYVDSAHWQAMLDEVTHVKECLEDDNESEEHLSDPDNSAFHLGAPYLLRTTSRATRAELLVGIPPKHVVDQVLRHWFNLREPAAVCLHIPTFIKEYDLFWKNPRSTSPAWLSMLYSIICLGTLFSMCCGHALPGETPADPSSTVDFYMTKAVQGLVLADYTVPGKYKLEALMLYLGAEYLRSRDAQVALPLLVGIAVKCAMHAGLQRDPKHFPSLTPFEGEMRRRMWAHIVQLDTLVSFQVGLPRTIHEWQWDTEPPRNLHDEDFDEDTKVFPPSRPESERTPVTYQICKSRILNVFGMISDKAFSIKGMSYDEVLLLDLRLREGFESRPELMKVKPIGQCITDPPDLVMHRYYIQLLYLKARCVLHRHAFTCSKRDRRATYSTHICVEAAMEILRHQKDIHSATEPGGILGNQSWYITSLTTHDLIMAAMIICLALAKRQQSKQEAPWTQHKESDMLEALKQSYRVWDSVRAQSYEAQKACEALTLLLGKTQTQVQKSSTAAGDLDQNGTGCMLSPPNPENFTDLAHKGLDQEEGSEHAFALIEDGSVQSVPVYDWSNLDTTAFDLASEGLINEPATIDWNSWDAHFIPGRILDPNSMNWMEDPTPSSLGNIHL